MIYQKYLWSRISRISRFGAKKFSMKPEKFVNELSYIAAHIQGDYTHKASGNEVYQE